MSEQPQALEALRKYSDPNGCDERQAGDASPSRNGVNRVFSVGLTDISINGDTVRGEHHSEIEQDSTISLAGGGSNGTI